MSRERILVVANEENVRSVVSRILTNDGYEVSTAANGEEALETFKQAPFLLVIADMQMNGMSGVQLLHEIKKIQPDTQVVMMTDPASLDPAMMAMRSGAYDYLVKPFENLYLISLVTNRAMEEMRLTVENRNLIERLQKNNEELERINKLLRELAIRDGLTGLFNHRYFQETLVLEMARSRRTRRAFSLLFLDLDYFKKYNDTHGHVQGDDLLKTLAKLLTERLRSSDLAARYGGEEFVVILAETTKEGAWHIAETIRKSVEEHPFPGRDTQPGGSVTISIGVATYPEDGDEAPLLLKHADEALYRAKRIGCNHVCS